MSVTSDTVITSATDLRALVGDASVVATQKELPALDHFMRDFIAASPLLLIASQGADGHLDVSPRGDPAGFVHVADTGLIYVPERPGNRRVDTLLNVIAQPDVSVLFLVPGVTETLRVRGQAQVVTGPVLEQMAVQGRAPTLAVRVHVRTAFFHCGKALIRSDLWSPEATAKPKGLAPFSEALRAHANLSATDADLAALIQRNYEETLY